MLEESEPEDSELEGDSGSGSEDELARGPHGAEADEAPRPGPSVFFVVDGAPVSETLWRWFNRHLRGFDPAEFERAAAVVPPELARLLPADTPSAWPGVGPEDDSPAAPASTSSSSSSSSSSSTTHRPADPAAYWQQRRQHQQPAPQQRATPAAPPARARSLRRLNARGLMVFCERLLMLATGIDKDEAHVLSQEQSPPEQVLRFVDGPLLQAVLYWCLTEGHASAEAAFEGLDDALWSRERAATGRAFHFRMHYMHREIRASFERVARDLARVPAQPPGRALAVRRQDRCDAAMLRAAVRSAYRGDLDAFILETISFIQFRAMGRNHEKLAQAVRFEKMQIADFADDSMAPYEVWRFLYPNYFDTVEDYFDTFFERFTAECVLFYLEDYVQSSFGLVWVPVYGLFFCSTDGRRSADLFDLLSRDALRRAVARKYGEPAAAWASPR